MRLNLVFLASLALVCYSSVVNADISEDDTAEAPSPYSEDTGNIVLDANNAFKNADVLDKGYLDEHDFALWYGKKFSKTSNRGYTVNTDGLVSGVWNSLAMIVVTELGDKTFFVAAIMAMKFARMPVYGGATAALALMTVLSALIGFALPALLSPTYTFYAAVGLFMFFGSKMLHETYEMYSEGRTGPSEELEETEAEFMTPEDDIEGGGNKGKLIVNHWKIFSQAFTITFLAEWGDRSQIATIAMAAAKNPYGVTIGGIFGHAFCTGLAVLGGKLLASRISERTVALCGGILFWMFAFHSIWVGPEV